MKGILTVAVAVAVAVSATRAVSGQPMQTVRDSLHRFTISVPMTWTVHQSTGSRSPAISATAPAPAGQLPDSVDVTVRDFITPITPRDCASLAATVMRFSIHTWTTLKEGPTTLDDMQAFTRDYVWHTSTGVSRRSVQTCVTVGHRAFLLVGTTANPPTAAEQDLPQIEDIIATFRPVSSTLPSSATPTRRFAAPICPRSHGGRFRVATDTCGPVGMAAQELPRFIPSARIALTSAESDSYLTPEARARREIDRQLQAAGWAVQDADAVNLAAAQGVAVREFV